MLKAALNALTAIHSRPAMLKRLGNPDLYSPCRVTPSNFFRFLRGPEYTTIRGVELIIPVDTMSGQFGQVLSFNKIPDTGVFKIKFGTNISDNILYNATAVEVQTTLRLLPPLSNVLVTGSFTTGFRIIFAGFSSMPEMGQLDSSTLEQDSIPVTAIWKNTTSPWSDLIKKGDRIIDGARMYSVDEIIEMHDLGAQVMAVRVRCD